jgi:hypothetical protein
MHTHTAVTRTLRTHAHTRESQRAGRALAGRSSLEDEKTRHSRAASSRRLTRSCAQPCAALSSLHTRHDSWQVRDLSSCSSAASEASLQRLLVPAAQ